MLMAGCKIPGPLCATRSEPIDTGTLNRQRSPAPKPVGSYRPTVLKHRWVDAATYHRTFLTTAAYANRYHIDVLADISLEADVGYPSPFRAAWIKAYEVDVNAKSFAPTFMMKKPDQDFAKYATPFEQEYSDLVRYHNVDIPLSVPVVVLHGDDYLVVGYVAEVQGTNLFVPDGVAITSSDFSKLGEVLERGVPFFMAKKEGPLWRRASIGEFNYSVLARVDGGVIQFLTSRATGFVESEFGPILFIATALAPLGQGLVRSLTNSVFGGEGVVLAEDLALDGMTEELAQSVTAEEASVLPRSAAYVRKSGITPTHFKAFQDAAKETDLIVVVRNGKESAIPLIEKGCPGKPKIFEPFNTNERTGILTASTEADKQLVYKNNYILVNENRVATRLLANGSLQNVELKSVFWQLEPGQVIDPALMKPVVGDYDLMGVFSPTNAGQNVTLVSKYGVTLENRTSPVVEKLSQTVNRKLDLPRVLHGAQDQYAGFRKGATAFFPDGTAQYMETEAQVKAFYGSVGRQPIKGSYR
jgi:hypothetical protein